jgi:hypothetical protein
LVTPAGTINGHHEPGEARVGSDVGVSQVVKLRLTRLRLPSSCHEAAAALPGPGTAPCGVRSGQNLGRRAAEKTYDITAADPTVALSWHRFGLDKLFRANREQWLPWHAQVPYLARSAVRPPPGDHAGEVERLREEVPPAAARSTAQARAWPGVAFKEKDLAWLTGGGRALALPGAARENRAYGPWQWHELCRVNPHVLPYPVPDIWSGHAWE